MTVIFNQTRMTHNVVKNLLWVLILLMCPIHIFSQKINTISPSSISTKGGDILVAGSDFGTTVGKIYFNGHEIPVVSWSNNIIRVTIPAGVGTNIPLQIQKSTGTMSNLLDRFSYDFPSIDAATPLSGVAAGGTIVTLSGNNFGPTGTSFVTVGGVQATIISQTHTEIILKTPAGSGNKALVVWVNAQSDFVSFDYQTALPLEWLNFSAYNTESGNRLSWVTANERNTAFFDMQRSKDGITWESLAQVPSNKKGGGRYEWTDVSPITALTYYRIRQLDFDGAFMYSPTRSVKRATDKKTFFASPNPTRDFVNLEGYGEDTQLTIVNNIGHVVGQKILRGVSEQVDLSQFPSGLYVFRIQKGKEVTQLKVLKVN